MFAECHSRSLGHWPQAHKCRTTHVESWLAATAPRRQTRATDRCSPTDITVFGVALSAGLWRESSLHCERSAARRRGQKLAPRERELLLSRASRVRCLRDAASPALRRRRQGDIITHLIRRGTDSVGALYKCAQVSADSLVERLVSLQVRRQPGQCALRAEQCVPKLRIAVRDNLCIIRFQSNQTDMNKRACTCLASTRAHSFQCQCHSYQPSAPAPAQTRKSTLL